MRRRLRSLRRRRITPPHIRAGPSRSCSSARSPPLRRHITLGREARLDRVTPGPSRSRTRTLRAAATRSRHRRPLRRRRPLRHPLRQLHLLHRQGLRPHHHPLRLRSAPGRSRAGARATGITSIPGPPATLVPRARARCAGSTVIRRVVANTGRTTTTTRRTTAIRPTRSSTGTATRTTATATRAAATATRAAATATTTSRRD